MRSYLFIAVVAVFAPALHVQTANPLSTELREMYTIIKTNLLKMARKADSEPRVIA